MPINQHVVDVSHCWSDTNLLETVASELARVMGDGSKVRRVYFDSWESLERFRQIAEGDLDSGEHFIEVLNAKLSPDFPPDKSFRLDISKPETAAEDHSGPYLQYIPIQIVPKS